MVLSAFASMGQNSPKLPGIHEAMQSFITSGDMSGAVTIVITKDQLLHQDMIGMADISRKELMQPNTLFAGT